MKKDLVYRPTSEASHSEEKGSANKSESADHEPRNLTFFFTLYSIIQYIYKAHSIKGDSDHVIFVVGSDDGLFSLDRR